MPHGCQMVHFFQFCFHFSCDWLHHTDPIRNNMLYFSQMEIHLNIGTDPNLVAGTFLSILVWCCGCWHLLDYSYPTPNVCLWLAHNLSLWLSLKRSRSINIHFSHHFCHLFFCMFKKKNKWLCTSSFRSLIPKSPFTLFFDFLYNPHFVLERLSYHNSYSSCSDSSISIENTVSAMTFYPNIMFSLAYYKILENRNN